MEPGTFKFSDGRTGQTGLFEDDIYVERVTSLLNDCSNGYDRTIYVLAQLNFMTFLDFMWGALLKERETVLAY